jgi:hypothetical protein
MLPRQVVAAGFDRSVQDCCLVLNVRGSWPDRAPMLGFDTNTPVKAQLFEFVRRYRIVPGAVERRNPAPWQEGIDRPEDINASSSCRFPAKRRDDYE